MFSVPGWNVNAPIATQVEKAKPKDVPEGKKSQKRSEQRKRAAQAQVDGDNLGEYWQKVIDGKADGDIQPSDAVKPTEAADGAEKPVEGAAEEPSKKRKRRSRDKKKEDKPKPIPDAGTGTNSIVVKPRPEPVKEKDASTTTDGPPPNKRERKRLKREALGLPTNPPKEVATQPTAPPAPEALTPLLPELKNLTPLQKSMRAKLTSARFRHLNESLYTKPSQESLDIFKTSPEMFDDYHRGFAQQVEVWPSNPVDGYVDAILTRGKISLRDPWKDKKKQSKKSGGALKPEDIPDEDEDAPAASDAAALWKRTKPLPRAHNHHCTVADLGCGTASLSHRLQPHLQKLNLTMHSFDLSKPTGPTASLVTVADISSLPLPSGSVDVAIFCLALMGTNWLDFIDEAYRILRWKGELWVSEIKSRFGRVENKKNRVPINSIGSLNKKKGKGKKKTEGEEIKEGIQDSDDEREISSKIDGVEGKSGTDVSAFVAVMRTRGFILDALPEKQDDAIDMSNKMFVKMQFVKYTQPSKGKNVKKDGEDNDKRGMKKNMQMGIKGKKFNIVEKEEEEDGGDEKDAKVLKPCLYKIR